MINAATCIVFAVLIVITFLIGFMFGRVSRQVHYQNLIETEREHFRETSEEANKNHSSVLERLGRAYEAETRDLTRRNIKLLDEIAQVTGIDVVELPSFGTVYLNHSKTVREAMQALFKEDIDSETEDIIYEHDDSVKSIV